MGEQAVSLAKACGY
jgi:propionyl-CoA carboxylase alpha chain